MSSRNKRLARARKVRRQAAAHLAALEAGESSVREILVKMPPPMKPVTLWTLLKRTPTLGEVRAKKVCEKAQVWPMVRLGNMSPEARTAVLNHLPERVK